MVNFQELLGEEEEETIIDPFDIFKDLEKQSDMEYLRPAQKSVLLEWHSSLRNNNGLIVLSIIFCCYSRRL